MWRILYRASCFSTPARCAGRIAIESLLSNLNEPRNNIVRGVSVSPASGASSWPSGDHGRDPGARCTSGL